MLISEIELVEFRSQAGLFVAVLYRFSEQKKPHIFIESAIEISKFLRSLEIFAGTYFILIWSIQNLQTTFVIAHSLRVTFRLCTCLWKLLQYIARHNERMNVFFFSLASVKHWLEWLSFWRLFRRSPHNNLKMFRSQR